MNKLSKTITFLKNSINKNYNKRKSNTKQDVVDFLWN
jgi:hypothetical protein